MFGFLKRPAASELKISVEFVVAPDGEMFHAFSPALKGLHADGSTADEAARNFVSEIPAYLESLAKHDDPLPVCRIEVVHEPEHPAIPIGAFLRHVQVQWPSLRTSGIS